MHFLFLLVFLHGAGVPLVSPVPQDASICSSSLFPGQQGIEEKLRLGDLDLPSPVTCGEHGLSGSGFQLRFLPSSNSPTVQPNNACKGSCPWSTAMIEEESEMWGFVQT